MASPGVRQKFVGLWTSSRAGANRAIDNCAATALGSGGTSKHRVITYMALAKPANAISAETSVAISLSNHANGQSDGFAHTFLGRSCEPIPWSGVRSEERRVGK